MAKYDLVVIGAGPAGMTAAIYGHRGNLNVLLLDRLSAGGAVLNTNTVENYPGVGTINGAELGIKMFEQCMEMGIEFDYATVEKMEVLEDNCKRLYFKEEGKEPVDALTVVIACGTSPRMLHVPGEYQFAGHGISWCAICDGAKYKGMDVVVIGGGNSAIDEGTYLASICNHVTVVTDFDLTGDATSAEYFRTRPNVTVHAYKAVKEFVAENDKLAGVKFADKETGENEQVVKCDGVFEYIGATPNTKFTEGLGITEPHGFLEVDAHMKTTIPGVFGAGDSNSKFLRQIVTATSDGAIAAQEALGYIKNLKKAQM